ncbi:alanine racemase [Neobacillus niacini]|uniref:alanine racemase n=1 Tax=Neobacillus niacini TaxID=86668 RepID=UPI00204043AE|nr:alanine racemase [Neobacillus niacini]MCM3694658.1 alanine racemase [Neobacillus niacini]
MTEQGYFYRDTWAEVDLDYILANVTSVKKLLPPNVEIIAVVKANAYGHGDFKVAESALKAGATYLAVAFMDEAIALRNKGVLAPILVLGATRPEDAPLAVKYKITLTVFQLEWITAAQSYLPVDKVLPVHIKLDTGMGRIGIRTKEDLAQVVETISGDERLAIEGVFTHFATADEIDHTYLDKQLALFHDLLSVMKEQPKYIHCSNSAAALRFTKANFNAVRLGIAMYGLTPSPEIENELPFPLQEAFSLRSRLVHVKKLVKGDKVSYGATYEAEDEEWIGTIPIGYADGWIRRLQGQEVLVEGKRVPIVGRICMDQCMVKLPHEVPVGTTVTLIGNQNNEFISVNEIAEKLETINYEVPCIISTRVPRLYKQGGKIVVLKNYLLHE